MKKIFAMSILLLVTFAAMAQTEVRNFKLPVSNDGEAEMMAYIPKDANGMAILDCPGGGYEGLAMTYEGTWWADFFTSRGIAYFVLKYRMPNGRCTVPFTDATNAMKIIRDSAQVWNINPQNVGIMGFSAGGHLASTVATHAEYAARPNFQILFYPVITMKKGRTHEGSAQHLLGAKRDSAQYVDLYSNELQVRTHLTPPALLLLSDDDVAVNPAYNGAAYYQSLREQGIKSSMHIYPTGGHGWGLNVGFKYHQQMLRDLSDWLETIKAPRQDAIRVACVGNSITDGFGIDYNEKYGYPAQLQQMLGDGYNVKNYGVGARTMLNKGDFPYMKEMAWRDCKAFNPNIVVIKLGTNDSKPCNWKYGKEFSHDMQQMIDELKALPAKPKIYLATPIKAFDNPYTIDDKVITDSIIPIIQSLAKKNKLELIDLHSTIADPKLLIGDGVHPNWSGARKIAEAVYKHIH